MTAQGRKFILTGRGTQPTAAQVQRWLAIEGRLDLMVSEVIARCQAPRNCSWKDRFSPEDLLLHEVRLEWVDENVFFFDTPLDDEIEMWPMATFSGLVLQECGWTV